MCVPWDFVVDVKLGLRLLAGLARRATMDEEAAVPSKEAHVRQRHSSTLRQRHTTRRSRNIARALYPASSVDLRASFRKSYDRLGWGGRKYCSTVVQFS